MGKKVAKFGGSSLADAKQFKKVADIIKADDERVYVVPSAPGKRTSDDIKVTDMLYALHEKAGDAQAFEAQLAAIQQRYDGIIAGLNLQYDISAEMQEIKQGLLNGKNADYAASRGEYLSGKVLSAYLGFDFIDPAQFIKFNAQGEFDAELTNTMLSQELQKHEKAVIPGFFGSLPNGEVKTFSRGGSDVTGAIVARAGNVSLYENWTDVSGFLMCDPRIVENPKGIAVLSYRELRELSYMGATVLHDESIFPVRKAGIPINVRNTNRPQDEGTTIMNDVPEDAHTGLITGIAGRKGFLSITIEKDLMNNERGFCRKLLSILEKHDVSIEHMPTGIDTVSMVVEQSQVANGKLQAILDEITATCQPDTLDVSKDIAMVATVGHGMQQRIGMAARLFAALAENNVNIRMIDQGSSELNIIIGIAEADFEKALRGIYNAFCTE
ncbi:aspartate kinase [Clostridia bacterium OttesenSCG-928-F22]|nr:aspartate kinase [Clostridia bacterium OttesenSCG-928-F22]